MSRDQARPTAEAAQILTIAPGLVWSIKATFVDYVERMSDGAVTVDGGASRLQDGAFHFPLDASSPGADAAFRGSVRFTGHFGMLVVTFADPALVPRGSGLHLSIVNDEDVEQRVDVLDLGSGARTADVLRFERPQLTRAGAELFFDKYRAGSVFDPVLVVEGPRDLQDQPS